MIIDMRARPPFGTYLQDGFIYDHDTLVISNGPRAAIEKNLELFIQEMNENGIDKVVAPVRVTNNGKNDVAAELLEMYPDRIIGMAGVNPLDDINYTLGVIDKYAVNGNFIGVNVEPGFTPHVFAKNGLTCDDERIYPIYEKCEKENQPIMLSFGGMCHDRLELFTAEQLDRVCGDFPNAKFIIAHGGYPRIPEVFWIALRRGNLWIQPDVYVGSGGGHMYIEAAATLNRGKILFGSAYPAYSFEAAVKLYQSFNMVPDVYAEVMGGSAAKLFEFEE